MPIPELCHMADTHGKENTRICQSEAGETEWPY